MQNTFETPSERVTLPLMFFFALSGPKIDTSTTYSTSDVPFMLSQSFTLSQMRLTPCRVS